MTEQNNFDDLSIEEKYRLLGRAVGHAGIKPSEGIQEIIKKDPDKQKAFLEGAVEGTLLKSQEEEQSQQIK